MKCHFYLVECIKEEEKFSIRKFLRPVFKKNPHNICNLWLDREKFGPKHHKYSDALLDYGFFLLNIDAIDQSVQVYQAALDIRQAVFGGSNLHVAIAHEDLAYSSYVHEYSTGLFTDAQ